MKKEHLKTVRVRNLDLYFSCYKKQKLHFLKNRIFLIATLTIISKCNEWRFNILLIPLLLKVPLLAKGVSGARERSQVSGDHEEPGEEIRHPGAAEGRERGRHGG